MIWLSTSRTSWRLDEGRPDQAGVSGVRALVGCGRGGGQWSVGCGTWWPSERLTVRFAEP